MAHPTTRILALLELLQARPGLTGPEIARRLEIDERTVRRYASRLVDLGIPVVAERGRYGGYRLLPGYRLPPLMLDDDEATAVVLGLVAGRALGLATTTTGVAAESALAKLQRVLPAALRERVAAVESSLGLTLPERGGRAPETAIVLALAAAAHQRRRVRIRYASYRGEASERDLDPYGLVVHGGRWYVTGHDHRRGEVRTFRLDRITGASLTDSRFDPPPDDFDPVRSVTQSLARVPYAHEVEVVFTGVGVDEVRRRIARTVGSLTAVEDGVLFQTRAERLDGMAQLLAGLGWPFAIRKPDDLRTAVRDLASALTTYVDHPGAAHREGQRG
jgi:predicted DNA-binding transcriptional regulator YafY